MEGRAEAQVSFYEAGSRLYGWHERLYFLATDRDRTASVHELDLAPSLPEPTLKRFGYGALAIERVTDDAVWYRDSRERTYAWTGFDWPWPSRQVSSVFPPPWNAEINGPTCIRGYGDINWGTCRDPFTMFSVTTFTDAPALFRGFLYTADRQEPPYLTKIDHEGRSSIVYKFERGRLTPPVAIGDAMFLTHQPAGATAHDLWRMTAEAEVPQNTGRSPATFGAERAVLGGRLLVVGTDRAHGQELWTTDGTAAGTRLVADIAPGADSSVPASLTVFRDALYFAAAGPEGVELWRSDGTPTGTQLVRDIHPHGDAKPEALVATRDHLYFRAWDGQTAAKLWVSDGTPYGTRPSDVTPDPSLPAVLGNDAYFWGWHEPWPVALWRARGDVLTQVLAPSLRQPIVIDGSVTDWTASNSNETRRDAIGDVAADDPIDWVSALVAVDANTMFLRYRTAAPVDFARDAQLCQVFFDADHRADTGYRIGEGDAEVGAEYLLEGETFLRFTGSERNPSWTVVARAKVASDGDALELSLDTRGIAGPTPLGSRLLFRAENPGTEDFLVP